MVVCLKNICPSTSILVTCDIYKNNVLLYQYLTIDIIVSYNTNIRFMKKAKEKAQA